MKHNDQYFEKDSEVADVTEDSESEIETVKL